VNLVKTLLMLAALMCIASLGTAATLRVALDGSQPYTVIQTAINASAHGDTVLVYPGRYYENIRFNGKNITLASLEMVSGDLQYQHSTILDGSHIREVILVTDNESNITIRGLTIMSGAGQYTDNNDTSVGGGIVLSRMSSPRNVSIINCNVTDNQADIGGGIWASTCNLLLSGVSITENKSSSGGGLHYSGNNAQTYGITFDPVNRCSIYNNKAAFGCDMYFYLVNEVHVVVDTFTVAVPSNFYAAAIPADTSIQNPYTFDILHSVHEEINHDLYVAPWGDDANDGLSEGTPYKTIFKAVYDIASDPDNPKTIHVAEGYYSPTANQQFFPVPMKNWTSLSGVSKSETIMDMEQHTVGISISPFTNHICIENISIINSKIGISTNRSEDIMLSNVAIKHVAGIGVAAGYVANRGSAQRISSVTISDVYGSSTSYGIMLSTVTGMIEVLDTELSEISSPVNQRALDISSALTSDVRISGCSIHDNMNVGSDLNNGIFQITPLNNIPNQRLGISIMNSAFYNNHQAIPSAMGYLWAVNDTAYINNCTFAGNSGGSAALAVSGHAQLTNNVFWDPQLSREILVYYNSDSGTASRVEFDNNCIRNGQNGVYNTSAQNQIIWKLNNIATDPMFANGGNAPYRLSSQSPLIDRGVQAALEMPAYDAGGNERVWDGNGDGQAVIDIGAYEYQPLGNPVNLTAQVWQQQVLLSWQMSAPERSLSGYRVYRNGEVYADILEPASTWFRDYSSVNDTLSYYVVALYGGVESEPSNTITVVISGVGNADELAPGLYGKVTVSPNPFADLAVVSYELDKIARTELKIYNLKGQLVRSLYTGTQGKGEQHLAWEGCDDRGRPVAAGIYILSLYLNGHNAVNRKIVKY